MPTTNGTAVQKYLMKNNLLGLRRGDGGLSKDWAYLIANTIDMRAMLISGVWKIKEVAV
jgi:hypothetical protein